MAEATSWQAQVLTQLEDDKGFTQLATEEMVKGVFAIKSNSDPKGFYYLIDMGWIVLCTCDGFRFRTDCSHSRGYVEKGLDSPSLRVVD